MYNKWLLAFENKRYSNHFPTNANEYNLLFVDYISTVIAMDNK